MVSTITLERLSPTGERCARIIGGVSVGAGLLLIAYALMARALASG